MPHSPREKRRVLARVRRVKGQLDAIERALEEGEECQAVMQQIAAVRGAVNGLMRQVLEAHIRETFGPDASAEQRMDEIEEINELLRSYLK